MNVRCDACGFREQTTQRYTSRWHKCLNHFLIFMHVYISSFFAMAMLLNLYRYAASLLRLATLLAKIFSGTLHSEVYQYVRFQLSLSLPHFRRMKLQDQEECDRSGQMMEKIGTD